MNNEKKSDEEWRKLLTPEQYRILRDKGTDRPFSNKYNNNHDTGDYYCAGCGNLLFRSKNKYDSGSGWPSFTQPASEQALNNLEDSSHGMRRIEVICARCEGHLGHVFDDGPSPSHLRYCINSTSLDFKEQEKK